MMHAVSNEDDFVDIFVEEAQGVFETLDHRLGIWRKLPTDKNALTEIRRCFHTLKGSGRMVHALDLAEVAWKVENTLNRALEGSIRVDAALVDLVSAARAIMPRMLEAFKNQKPIREDAEIEALIEQADALATGRKPKSESAQPAAVTPMPGGNRSTALEVVKLNRRLQSIQQHAEESLHRSEVALQHARRFGNHLSTMKAEVRDLVGRAELSPVIEKVDRLTSEMETLQRQREQSERQPLPDRLEINQIVDQVVRERLSPIHRQRGDLESRLEEAVRASKASRSLARLAMVLSALLGTMAIATLAVSGLSLG
jgi:chemotaxis protein histidine kinase CheA